MYKRNSFRIVIGWWKDEIVSLMEYCKVEMEETEMCGDVSTTEVTVIV